MNDPKLLAQNLRSGSVDRVRFAWCDLHGVTRCKTLMPKQALLALTQGVTLVSSLALKDNVDRSVFKLLKDSHIQGSDELNNNPLSQYANAPNMLLMPVLSTWRMLPWSPGTAWVQCELKELSGHDSPIDPRTMLRTQTKRLQAAGYDMQCGLEIEFHIYKTMQGSVKSDWLDPNQIAWPNQPPLLQALHPGFHLLSEQYTDAADEAMRIVERTALSLGLPLSSTEIEFGPSQFEAVFEPTDAMTAADNMVLFRSAIRQALARSGYYATFICRPPFENVMSSGWHLHHSLIRTKRRQRDSSINDFVFAHSNTAHTSTGLSLLGEQWLAGLAHHARAISLLCTSTANGYTRYRPNALAPTSVGWGKDDRSASFRVIANGSSSSVRIENRLGEPAANPYFYMGAQIIAGLNGIENRLSLPSAQTALPLHLGEAIEAFVSNKLIAHELAPLLVAALTATKQQEWDTFNKASEATKIAHENYLGRM
jgi:glutamine synthetase